MPTNDFLPFSRGAGANILTPSAFNPTPARQTGFQSGTASSAIANTVVGQAQFVASMITQFIVDTIGQSVLDNGNLTTLEGQFIAAIQSSVGSVPQAALWHFGRDAGTADLLSIPAAPIITAYADGMVVSTIVAATSLTTTPHMAANGLASVQIVNGDGTALTIGSLQAGSLVAFQYDSVGAHWRLIGNISISQASLLHRAADTGSANVMVCSTVAPPIAAVVDGMQFCIKKSSNPNTSSVTLTIGATTSPLVWGDGTAFTGGEWPANADGEVVYDSSSGGSFRLLGSPQIPTPIHLHSGIDTGTVNTIVSAMNPPIVGYVPGDLYIVRNIQATCTGAATANLGPGVKTIIRADGTACRYADFSIGESLPLIYDGTNLQVQGLLTSLIAGSGSQIYASAGTFTFTPPNGVTLLKRVWLWGAGGGGGGCVANGGGQAGAGGGFALKYNVHCTPGVGITVVVGLGGVGGIASTGTGGTGGTSSFASSPAFSATGGAGGVAGGTISTGSTPGSGSGGDYNQTGGGGSGTMLFGTGVFKQSIGGSAYNTSQQAGLGVNAVGTAGNSPGGGGAGAGSAAGAAYAGGAGADGLCIIEY